MRRGARETGTGRRQGRGRRVLTVRLPDAVYDFLVSEAAALALADGKNPGEVAQEARDVLATLKKGGRKTRGLLVFAEVVLNALELLRTYGAENPAMQASLERDRLALEQATGAKRLSRYDYMRFLLFARHTEVVRRGPGFDHDLLGGAGSSKPPRR